MKIQEPENSNYAAVVTTIENIVELEGCDNVVGAPLLGFQAIVSKTTKVGDRGIVFTAETQLSDEFSRENNLYRHTEHNKDKTQAGYIEDNRRVKAMKFRGHRSDCLFMPLSSLNYVKKLKPEDLKDGDSFDKIGDHEICKKYVVKRKNSQNRLEKNKIKFVRVDKKFLPEHYDSDQWHRNEHSVPEEKEIIVTQKLHGTSIRIANTVVARKHTTLEKLARRLGVAVKDYEYDYVFGSRKVIKDPNNPASNHFYDFDLWGDEGKKLQGLLPEGYIVYGELIGWAGERQIQKNYTYQVPEKTCDLYVYRVATINHQGFICDLSWDQTMEFCKDRNIKYTPELWRGKKKDFIPEDFMDKRFKEDGYSQAVPLDKNSPCDEGVCVRVDGIAPYILKCKGENFYAHESAMLDQEADDLEAEGNEE